MELQRSFSSANCDIPVKVVKNEHVMRGGFIAPVHLQWIPTNRCNANCSFCSCAGRNKSAEIDFNRSKDAIETFAQLGARAVTITGGGEPMLCPHIYDLFDVFRKNHIEIGLVSNALNAADWNLREMRDFRWMRLSLSDEYGFDGYDEKIKRLSENIPGVDLALSYVVSGQPNIEKIRAAMDITNKYRLTHIRFVFDIKTNIDVYGIVIDALAGIDTGRAIIQPRTKYARGTERCFISLLKPIIGADGNIYPCCGTQYANKAADEARDMIPAFKMGAIEDAVEIWRSQRYFDGSICEKCYYGAYNALLGKMREGVKHIDFV